MKKRSCRDCRKCNRKGKPSVTKYSLYCDKMYSENIERYSLFETIKNKMFEERFDEKTGELNKKGFRDTKIGSLFFR